MKLSKKINWQTSPRLTIFQSHPPSCNIQKSIITASFTNWRPWNAPGNSRRYFVSVFVRLFHWHLPYNYSLTLPTFVLSSERVNLKVGMKWCDLLLWPLLSSSSSSLSLWLIQLSGHGRESNAQFRGWWFVLPHFLLGPIEVTATGWPSWWGNRW